jgi:hypothetical protein
MASAAVAAVPCTTLTHTLAREVKAVAQIFLAVVRAAKATTSWGVRASSLAFPTVKKKLLRSSIHFRLMRINCSECDSSYANSASRLRCFSHRTLCFGAAIRTDLIRMDLIRMDLIRTISGLKGHMKHHLILLFTHIMVNLAAGAPRNLDLRMGFLEKRARRCSTKVPHGILLAASMARVVRARASSGKVHSSGKVLSSIPPSLAVVLTT